MHGAPHLVQSLGQHADPLGRPVAVTPYTQPRSCTTELNHGGTNILHIKELAGHEHLDALQHYAKLSIADLKKTHAKSHPRKREG